MNAAQIMQVVDTIHRDKHIDKEIVFEGIEQAILSAARKHYGEEEDVTVEIDRQSGDVTVKYEGKDVPPDDLDILGGGHVREECES